MERVRFSVLLVLLSLVLLPSPVQALSRVIELDSDASANLYGRMEFFGDKTGTLVLKNILLPGLQKRFVPLHGNLNNGFVDKAVWVRFTLRRTASFPSEAYLRLNPPIINHVTAYLQTGNDPLHPSSYSSVSLDSMVLSEKNRLRNPDMILPLTVRENTPVNVYLRIKSEGPIYLRGAVHSQNDLLWYTGRNLLFTGIVSTIIMIISLWTFLYYFYTRDAVFMIFSLFALSVLTSYLIIGGIPGYFLPHNSGVFSHILFRIGFSGELFFFIQIVLRVLKFSLTPLARGFMYCVSMLSFLNVLTFLLGFYTEVTQIISWFGIVTAILVFWSSLREDVGSLPDGRLYILSLQLLNFAYLLFYLKQLGIIPFESWSSSNFTVAAVINIIFLPIYMMRRLLSTKQKALELSMSSEAKAIEYAGLVTRELQENRDRLEIALAAEQNVNERQRMFFSMLSHEYRTPLAIIQGNVNIIEDEINEAYVAEFSKINVAIQRLVDVMEVSLERSRLIETKSKSGFRIIGAEEMAREQLLFAKWLWKDRSFFLIDETADARIFGDSCLLATALFNLLENASKYSPAGTDIGMSCRIKGAYIEYCVWNKAEGFHAPDIETLFQKYARGVNSLNTSGEGLGLYLVRWIVAQHQGEVNLSYVENGKFTATILIPFIR